VPRAKLACGRVGDDVDGTAVQPVIPVLRLLLGPAACMGRQLVPLHGAGNCTPTRRGGGACASGSRRVSWPTPQSESRGARARRRLVVRGVDLSCEAETYHARRRLIVRGGDLPCETETCRARRRLAMRDGDLSCEAETCRGEIPLAGNWSETLPTGRKHAILPVWVLTRVLSPPRLESWS
jgi:hypothetical protein